jgi:RNA-binding protein
MSLNRGQIKYLKGICHNIKPVVMLGNKGLTETVMAEIEAALDQHELIKLKLRGSREQREQWLTSIIKDSKAELVLKIGQVACLFRRNKDEPKLELPR